MTSIIVANSITAAVGIVGLAAVCRLGHLTAGGRQSTQDRRAA